MRPFRARLWSSTSNLANKYVITLCRTPRLYLAIPHLLRACGHPADMPYLSIHRSNSKAWCPSKCSLPAATPKRS